MPFEQREPSTIFKPYLKEFWRLSSLECQNSITLYPDGLIDILLNLGNNYQCDYQGKQLLVGQRSYISGVLTEPVR
jgi:hypothetical protein